MAYKRRLRYTATLLLISFTCQLVYPNVAYALTTGPSQPEVLAFEPVGTTDMVNMFTGDFVYNIPLLDVEGYPVNIAYHGGVGMEQEASWVGLGWNINPGAINRTVRGIPDDFNGETLEKELHIKKEENLRVGMGGGGELIGIGDPILGISASLGTNLNISNYRGVSADFSFSAGVNLFRCVSAGVNLGVGSQTGADIDYNAGVMFTSSQIMSKDMAAGVGVNFGHGYNTRSGVKDMNFSISTNARMGALGTQGSLFNSTVPIGVKNYVPVITNSSSMTAVYGRIKLGLEFAWCNIYGNINAMGSELTYDENGSRESYGFLYAQNAGEEDILDFTRDRDGMFNKTMQYLPPGHMTYDVYSVNGQGTGGSFRPFRNDLGSVFDPVTKGNSETKSGQAEASLGWLFGAGGDASKSKTNIYSGPWNSYKQSFTSKGIGNLYENVYFKQAGDMSVINGSYYSDLKGETPIKGGQIHALPKTKANSTLHRDPRSTLVTYFDAEEASIPGVAIDHKIKSYNDTNGLENWPNLSVTEIDRHGAGTYDRKTHHMSEFTQVQTDGRRYVYGIPAMNNIQKEVTFSIDAPTNANDRASGLVPYNSGTDDTKGNQKGIDNYYSGTTTPSHAHSYLLTEVLSADYADVTGDGPSNDDVGTYTKFNYTRKDADYRWRAPITSGKAQYNPGFLSDTRDDKASYVIGSREQWILHSMESKNYVAEFYTSERKDGKGVKDKIDSGTGTAYDNALSTEGSSYKLDSIILFSKHDRFINGADATPIKTIYFVYDYSLCQNVPNWTDAGTSGKLTLKSIYMKYGTSEKSMLSPYKFEYHSSNPDYDLAAKDRWGNYKPNGSTLNNHEFPFVDQSADNDSLAAAWSLYKVHLPSGGVIQVNYEADDYAYVQERKAMEMFMIQGIGNTITYRGGHEFYHDKFAPNLYIYFLRRKNDEIPSLSLKDNYLKSSKSLYFNCNMRMANGSYEQIKGYAEVDDVGYCNNDVNSDYGYIKLKPVVPRGGGGILNPCVYTALNVARYNLPHITYPGNDPNVSDIKNIIAGLKQAFNELVSFSENPLIQLIQKSVAKHINKSKSYIRLNSPGLKKVGGGHRVKSLLFYDSWNKLVGGNAQQATYGKNYDYTIDEAGYGTISSGVASYEPLIGGDENPYREPVKHYASGGSKWPPNDPVELYQETPIAESLLPSGVVGYRQVTVSSIHQNVGRSSQAVDVYKYCTAKEYPFQIKSSALEKLKDENNYKLKKQENILEVTQGYTVILNDMHGKPRSTEHYVRKPKGNNPLELISYQQYEYHESGGELNNQVPVMMYNNSDTSNMLMQKVNQTVGVEIDMTIDAREKTEKTYNDNFNVNVNATNVLFVLIPIPFPFGWSGEYHNEFRSAVATKVIQQYGILHKVHNYQDGTKTTVTNEAYDALTGQPVVTSVNNEFEEQEYSVTYPAYWGYKTMGPAYTNIGFEDTMLGAAYTSNSSGNNIVDANAFLYASNNRKNFVLGDKLLVKYNYQGQSYSMIAWVVGFRQCDGDPKATGDLYCCPVIAPRYPQETSNWPMHTQVDIYYARVLESGAQNVLNESMLEYSALSQPFIIDTSGTYFTDSVGQAISVQAKEYEFISNRTPGSFTMPTSTVANPSANLNDSNGIQNIASIGFFKNRVSSEYVYQGERQYPQGSRKAGLFNVKLYWVSEGSYYYSDTITPICDYKFSSAIHSSYFKPDLSDEHWRTARTITKWSLYGNEIENKDAIGNYSAASFGYQQQLPTSVTYNSWQEESFADGFEDYTMLEPAYNLVKVNNSPFKDLFTIDTLAGSSKYGQYNIGSGVNSFKVVNATAHTGDYCLEAPSSSATMTFDVIDRLVKHSDYHHMSFALMPGKQYIVSYWMRPKTITGNEISYDPLGTTIEIGSAKDTGEYVTNIIDGWQKVECSFTVPSSGASTVDLKFTLSSYVDDIRIHPADANMKAFVYHPFNQRLIATLDENNFATIYEYDQEGNLVRTKRETDQGIITISESRNANPKQ